MRLTVLCSSSSTPRVRMPSTTKAAQVVVHPAGTAGGQQRSPADDRRRRAGGAVEAGVLDRDLRPADHHDPGRLVVQVLDERGVVEHARQVGRPRYRRHRRARAGAQDERASRERPAAAARTVLASDRPPVRAFSDVLDAELLRALPVHVRVRAAALGAEQLDQLQDGGGLRVELAVPEPARERLGLIQFLGGLGEQVMRDARLVRARAAEERPALQHERPPAETAQHGGPEPPGAAAARGRSRRSAVRGTRRRS